MSDISDDVLVQHIIEHDQELYVHIVERYEAPLLRYARTIVFDHDIAADVVQQAFIKSFVNLRSFNPKLKFSSWLYRIVHNEAVNYIRKHKREVKPDDDWWQGLPDEKERIDETLDKAATKAKIGSAMELLSIKYRQPLVLHHFEGKSYKQISDILRLSINTVGIRISRAKRQLAEILISQGVDHG
jgi:RNA polymerase sigma-70 factor (ECF subfamily)